MPFANHPRVISRRLQIFGKHRLRIINVIENRNAVEVRIFSGEDHGAARRTNRIRDEGVREAHSFTSDAVNVGRVDKLAAVRANRMRRVIVGHDEDDIGRFGLGGN